MIKEEVDVEENLIPDEKIEIILEHQEISRKPSLRKDISSKKGQKVSFKEDVQIYYTVTYHARKQSILSPEFWINNALFFLFSVLLPLMVFVFEVVIIATQYGKSCDQPLMTLFIGECILAFFTFLYFLSHAIYKIFVKKVLKQENKSKLKNPEENIPLTVKPLKSPESLELNKGDLEHVKEPKRTPKAKGLCKDLKNTW